MHCLEYGKRSIIGRTSTQNTIYHNPFWTTTQRKNFLWAHPEHMWSWYRYSTHS